MFECCAFFLIPGYFIGHQVIFRPWGSLPNQKRFTKKKHYATTGRNFFFSDSDRPPCYQMPEPSRPMPAARTQPLSVCATARWCRPLLIVCTIPTVCHAGGLRITICYNDYNNAYPSDCTVTVNILLHNTYPSCRPSPLGKTIPGRITTPG